MKTIQIQNKGIMKELILKDFYSALASNGRNVEVAISQVSTLREIDRDEIRTMLRNVIENIKQGQTII